MTTNATTAEDRLAKLGIHLPDAPTPFGAYVPAVQTGNLLFLSGMLATSGHTVTVAGIVGKDLDVRAGREAAYTSPRRRSSPSTRRSPMPRRSCFAMSSAKRPSLLGLSLVSRACHSVRR